MDSRLTHLLEAKKSLLDRWKGQRLNRKLRKKIAQLNGTTEEHCQVLAKQQWDELCNSVDGQMRVGGKWNLLKHLLDDTNSKSNQRHAIEKVLHEAKRSEPMGVIADKLANRYLPVGSVRPTDYPTYKGEPNPTLDEPFSTSEVRAVLHSLNGRSASGPDGISNRALRNLDDDSIEYLTEEINRVWKQGLVPETWKSASVILIPKPGKPPGLANLRPISLTSCVGKVAEHVIHKRISDHVEKSNLFPYNMVGFRPALSTQDAMKLIKCQIIDNPTRDVRAILGLDLEKAFDNVSHAHILNAISDLNLGASFHGYISSFLKGRKATLKIGDLTTEAFELGPRGTPQGAVVSPLLFNIAMRGLSEKLSAIDGVNHTIYADDITIWCTKGCEGDIEASLQSAVNEVESYLENTGLKCSPSKSELLLYRPIRRGPKPRGWKPLADVDIRITTRDGNLIPRVESIRMLGMVIESNGSNRLTLDRITKKTERSSDSLLGCLIEEEA